MSLTRLTAPSEASESATLTLPLIHVYPNTPLQNETIVPVDVKQQQRLCHLFAFARICTQTHRLTLSLSLSHC